MSRSPLAGARRRQRPCEANRLSVALHNHRSAGVDIVAALQGAGADVNAVADLAKRAA